MAVPYQGKFLDKYPLQPIGQIEQTKNHDCKELTLNADELISNMTIEWND